MLEKADDAVGIIVDVVEQTQDLNTHVADASNGGSELRHGDAKG